MLHRGLNGSIEIDDQAGVWAFRITLRGRKKGAARMARVTEAGLSMRWPVGSSI
jgi:hypothetical protein